MTPPRPLASRLGMAATAAAAVALAIVLVGGGSARADEPARGSDPAGSAARFSQRSIQRLALMDLRLQSAPTGDDYRIAGALFDLAQTLAPDDVELARRRVEAAFRAGDQDLLWRATRDVVRLDPRDSVAVLRLISMTITRLQTSQERLDAYDRYLGPAGNALDPAIRSRLALDAALLVRERGDDAGFAARLARATRLDPTNKDAASLAATYYALQTNDDPVGELELIVNLLLADPLDPQVHLTLARHLARGGAVDQAERFHAIARRLTALDLGGLPESLDVQRLVLDWYRDGPGAPLTELNDGLANERYIAASLIRELEANDQATSQIRKPQDIRLTSEMERVRILSAHASQDVEALDASFADLATTLDQLQQRLMTPTSMPVGLTIDDARLLVLDMAVDKVIAHLQTGYQAQRIINDFKGTTITDPDGPAGSAHVGLWIALYDPDPAPALAGFEALVGTYPLAPIGVGMARERLGDLDGAIASYQTMMRFNPLMPEAAWARTRAALLAQAEPFHGPHADELTRVAREIPRLVDAMARDPLSFMRLDATLVSTELDAVEPLLVRLSLQNTSSMPMGLGPAQAINSRLMIAPSLDVGITNRNRFALPEVVELDRRLRLMPLETVEAIVSIDAGFTGWYTQTASTQSQRMRARVIQGFRLRGGVTFPGPMCLTKEVPQARRHPNAYAAMDAKQLTDQLVHADPADIPELLLAVRSWATSDGAPDDLQGDGLIAALIDRYTNADAHERMMMLAALPHAGVAPTLARFDSAIDLLASREQDPGVLLVMMATRATSPDDPIFAAAALGEHEDLLTIAVAIRERLASGATTFATAGPSIESFAGISPSLDDQP